MAADEEIVPRLPLFDVIYDVFSAWWIILTEN